MPRERRARLVAAAAVLPLLGSLPVDAQAAGSDFGVSATAGSSHSSEPDPSLDALLSAIEALESENDVKSQSSANLLEDSLFGTPLTDAARDANVALQEQLARLIWARASRAARQAGESAVPPERVERAIATLESSPTSGPRVAPAGSAPVSIPAPQASRYASVPYSLRAILSVQQADILFGAERMLALEPASVDALREFLDAVSLSALLLADRDARGRRESAVSEAVLRSVWSQLVPDLGAEPESSGPPRRSESRVDPERRARAIALLDASVDRKVAAYRRYNHLAGDDVPLLVFNISRFYAREPVSAVIEARRRLVDTFVRELDAFASDLLREAARSSRAAGHLLIRGSDATAAAQRLIPSRVDEFEDVLVFEQLDEEDRVTLDSFDCDSFRDFGAHWWSLRRAVHAAPSDSALPDPRAAEILAEAVSQYGVLLLRIAGTIARDGGDTVRLQPSDIEAAAPVIRERAERDRAAIETPAAGAGSPSGTRARGGEREPAVGAFFSDATTAAGLKFTHRSSTWLGEFRHKQLKTPPTFSGGGVAAEDIDGDSDIDLLFVGGGGNALLLNDGHGHFVDATREAGIDWLRADGSHGEPRDPIIADFDNDGRQDILITYANDANRLYRNVGGARFEDVTNEAGLGGEGLIAGPATVFDFDADGLLDIYIGYFGDYLHGAIPAVDHNNQNALPNKLFRNVGGMRFEDVTEGSGTADLGWAQAVSHVDFDRDGLPDIIVANDYGRNAFLRNLGSGKFQDLAPALGMLEAFHSMNVGITDINDDDFPDIYISNLAMLVKDGKFAFPDVNTPIDFDLHAMPGIAVKESNMFYVSQVEDSRLVGYVPSSDMELGSSSTGWAWDAEFFDFDHDADDDLYVVNGTNDFNTFSMVYRPPDSGGRSRELLLDHRRESNVFLLHEAGKLKDASARSGADFAANSRSTSYLDYDDDGDLDIAVSNFHAAATLLRNDSDKQGRGWLKLRLVGDPSRSRLVGCDGLLDCGWAWLVATLRRWLDGYEGRAPEWLRAWLAPEPDPRSNRDAIGARILVTLEDGTHVRREVQGGSGYLSMNPKQQHFGIGGSRAVDARIIWPNGEVQMLSGLTPNASYTVQQGVGIVDGVNAGEDSHPTQ